MVRAVPFVLLAVPGTIWGQAVTLNVDATRAIGPISPFVYGTNQPDWIARRGATFVRWGGNRTTAYNWEINASNAGSDWMHQNDAYLGGGETPLEALRPLLANGFANGAAALVTIPTIGYVAADKNGGGDVNQTANYLQTRFRRVLPRKPTKLSTSPVKTDAFVYADEMVFAIGRKFPDRPLWFALDNEPDLWDHTHARLRSAKLTYSELLETSRTYAESIKRVLPRSLVFGPASYGWNGYTTLQDAPDKAKGDFLEWYLEGMRRASRQSGRRLLDVLDLHYYSEARGGTYRVTEDRNDADTVAARVQSSRSLYDPTYTESSWISQWSTNGPLTVIPRMRAKIAAKYPGTRLAFTEWNFGGGRHPSGAVATADALGAFGRGGVFAAAFWDLTDDERYSYAGLGAYRNFDNQGATFGDVAVNATTANVARVQVYAARDGAATNRVTLVVINRDPGPSVASLNVAGIVPTAVRGFRVGTTGATPTSAPLPPFVASGWNVNLPGHSVTTIELRR